MVSAVRQVAYGALSNGQIIARATFTPPPFLGFPRPTNQPEGGTELTTIDPDRAAATGRRGDGVAPRREVGRARRSTETKAAFKTTELIAYIAAVVAVLIAGMVIDQSDAGGLGGRQVWLYVTILTVGYMLSRGLAKSGSRDPYWDDDGHDRGDR
jgi:hypothetical protein